MQNEQIWAPSKYVRSAKGLLASSDPKAVSASSRVMAQKVADFFNRSIPQYARGRLLDLGCGSAPLFGLYRDYVSEVVCVDWGGSPHDVSYIDVAHDINEPLPFPDGHFDTIILSDVLEHIQEPQLLWHEMARVLSKGGRILLNVPFFYWLHERPHDYYRYTEFALQRFVQRSSLTIVELAPLGGAPEILGDILAKVIAGYRWGRPFASTIQRLCAWFVGSRPGARLSRRTAARFPFGYALVAEKR